MSTAIFFQSVVFLWGTVRNVADRQGNAYDILVGSCTNPHDFICAFLVPFFRGVMKQMILLEEGLGHNGSLSDWERFAAMFTGSPSGVVPHGLRHSCVSCSKAPVCSVTTVSAAEEQLWLWGSTSLPQRMMADVNPTVTVEQCSALAASGGLVVTHFPMAMTLQARAAVLKCPLSAKSGASDKLHICHLLEAQSEGPENGKCSHPGDAAGAAFGRERGADKCIVLVFCVLGYDSWHCWSHVVSEA